jgi:hypothetical protein
MARQKEMTLDQFFIDNPEWRPYADLVAVPPTSQEIQKEFPDADPEVCARCFGGDGLVSVGALYVRIRREGAKDRFAAMLALQEAPRIMTDAVFFEGAKRPGDEFDDQYLGILMKSAKRQGFVPPPGARYFPSLARFRGDKEAWVGQGDGRGYIKQLCEKRGWAVEGAVSAQHREPERDPLEKAPRMAESLIRENAQRMVKQNPELKRLSRRDLRQHVLDKHGAKK